MTARATSCRARDGRLYHQGVDEHYDQISAFIKSVRGSDPDAGLYWLARMLDAGEDARFLARRLVILASEDVGMADPHGPRRRRRRGPGASSSSACPRRRSTWPRPSSTWPRAPKSNRVTVALGRARDDVRAGRRGDVPAHLRDAHYRSAGAIGHGEGYGTPTTRPTGWVDQQYRPDEAEGHVYYEPSTHGAEPAIDERLRARRRRPAADGP